MLGIPSNEVIIENNAQAVIEALSKRVLALEIEIKAKNDFIDLEEIENLISRTHHIEKSDIFWYINGHIIYDNVIRLLLSKVIYSHHRQQKHKYDSMLEIEVVKAKNRSYKNYIKDIKWETLLAINQLQCFAFDNSCPLMRKIKDDVIAFCQERKTK